MAPQAEVGRNNIKQKQCPQNWPAWSYPMMWVARVKELLHLMRKTNRSSIMCTPNGQSHSQQYIFQQLRQFFCFHISLNKVVGAIHLEKFCDLILGAET
jgi:hypothetical protein